MPGPWACLQQRGQWDPSCSEGLVSKSLQACGLPKLNENLLSSVEKTQAIASNGIR